MNANREVMQTTGHTQEQKKQNRLLLENMLLSSGTGFVGQDETNRNL